MAMTFMPLRRSLCASPPRVLAAARFAAAARSFPALRGVLCLGGARGLSRSTALATSPPSPPSPPPPPGLLPTSTSPAARRAAVERAAKAAAAGIGGASGKAPGLSAGGAPSGTLAAPATGTLARVRALLSEYGLTALSIYVTLWVAPGVLMFELASLNGNWGLDPLALLDYIGQRQRVTEWLGLPAGASLASWQTSIVLGFLATDALELARLPATIFLAPKVKKWMDARGARGVETK